MHARHQHGHITWIDLESPNSLEVRQIAAEFDIAESVAEELISPSTKTRAEVYPDYLYLVIQFPAIKHSHTNRQQEIDFVVGQDFLITARYDTVDALHRFAKVFDVQATLRGPSFGDHAGVLFYHIVRRMYQSVDNELDFIRHELAVIEEHIFSGREVEMVAAISGSARALLNLRQTIEPHRDVMRLLEENASDFFGEEFVRYARDLSGEYYRIHNHIMRTTDALHELRETNNALLSTRQNEITKLFTIMAFFTFPLALLVDVLSIPSSYNPLFGRPYDFWIIVATVLGCLFLMFLAFKHRKWL